MELRPLRLLFVHSRMILAIQVILGLSIIIVADSNDISSRSSSTSSSATPIRNFEPSWIASSSQGTTVAVGCKVESTGEDGFVLLVRSPNVGRKLEWREQDYVSLDSMQVEQDLWVQYYPFNNPRWKTFGGDNINAGTALCSMTGLASDMDYLFSTIQMSMEQHRMVYDPVHFQAPISFLVKNLANAMQEAVLYEGGRPYGVQAILIGRDISPLTTPRNKSLKVFTIDPTGVWQQWDGATAIGKCAGQVRKELSEELKTSKLSAKMAMETAMRALAKALDVASVNQEKEEYHVVLFWWDKTLNQCRSAMVKPHIVEACRNDIKKKLQQNSS